MDSNPALILLDVDGVLNPQVVLQKLVLNPVHAALVAELSELGTVVWATTWSAAHMYQLTRDLGLPTNTNEIAFPPLLHIDPLNPEPTPKLHWVARWIDRTFFDEPCPTTAIVWIDDQLREDATAWAKEAPRPTLLVKPEPVRGLTGEHVAAVRDFVNDLESRRTPGTSER